MTGVLLQGFQQSQTFLPNLCQLSRGNEGPAAAAAIDWNHPIIQMSQQPCSGYSNLRFVEIDERVQEQGDRLSCRLPSFRVLFEPPGERLTREGRQASSSVNPRQFLQKPTRKEISEQEVGQVGKVAGPFSRFPDLAKELLSQGKPVLLEVLSQEFALQAGHVHT